MATKCIQVYPFFQKKIAESGLVIDEDLEHMNTTLNIKEETPNKISKRLIILGTVIFGLFCTFQRERPGTMFAAGAVLALPVVSTYAFSLYNNWKMKALKNNLLELLDAFKCLSRIHTEVHDFLKCFERSMLATVKQPFNMSSESSALELAKTAFGFQVPITKLMKIIICGLNIELDNFFFDMEEFDKATSIELSYCTIKESIYNASFIEGQVILLRSHLLISIYLMCSTKAANPEVLFKIMEESVPLLVLNIREGISEVKEKLESIRFPKITPALNLSRLDKIIKQRSVPILPRIRRNLTKINDNTCCTIFKLQTLLVTLDNIQSEQQMIMLEHAVSNVAQELFQCYISTADFAKMLGILNGNQTHHLENKDEVERNPSEETISITNYEEDTVDESTVDHLEFQEFASNIDKDDKEDEIASAERRAVSIYRKAIKQGLPALMIELQHSDEFKKRQIKFKTVMTSSPAAAVFPTTSVASQPLLTQDLSCTAPDGSELLPKGSTMVAEVSTETGQECLSSRNSASTLGASMDDTSCSSYRTISNDDFLLEDPKNETVLHIPPPPPLPQSPTFSAEKSTLQMSLEGALAKIGMAEEETFE